MNDDAALVRSVACEDTLTFAKLFRWPRENARRNSRAIYSALPNLFQRCQIDCIGLMQNVCLERADALPISDVLRPATPNRRKEKTGEGGIANGENDCVERCRNTISSGRRSL
jgi:hypothetical protein